MELAYALLAFYAERNRDEVSYEFSKAAIYILYL